MFENILYRHGHFRLCRTLLYFSFISSPRWWCLPSFEEALSQRR